MKQLKLFSTLLMCLFALSFAACGKDDDTIGGAGGDSGNNGAEEYDYSLLDLKNYQDWDIGAITKENTYFLLRSDTATNGYIGYINNTESSEKGVFVYFDEHLSVTKFYTEYGACYINKLNEEYASVHILTDEKSIFLDTVSINKAMHKKQIAPSRTVNADFLNSAAQGISNLMDVQSWGEIGSNILHGNLDNLFFDVAQEISTGILLNVNPVTVNLTNLSFNNLKSIQTKLDEKGVKLFLGDCDIKITRVKKIGINSYTLYLSISNTSSIPPTQNGKDRVVKAALAFCSVSPVTYKNSSLRTVEFDVSSDSANIPIVVVLPHKLTYYVVPYLLPISVENTPMLEYIRYGNVEKLVHTTANIKNKEPISSEIICNDTISCVSSVTLTINKVRDIDEWGIYSPREGSAEKGVDYYPMAQYVSDGDVKIEKKLPLALFAKEVTPNSLTFKKEIGIGIYKKYRLTNGSTYMVTDDLQSMELIHKLSCTTGGATEVKEKAAIVSCSYEGISQYTTFGVKIFDKGEFTAEYNPLNNVYEFNIDNLQPKTTYTYCAYIFVAGEYYYGEEKTFTTKGDELCPDGNHVHAVDLGLSVKWACCNVGATAPEEYGDYFAWGETTPKSTYIEENCQTYGKNIGDISGNATYDAATANWGGSWRMSTKNEMQELVENCTWEWATVNGVSGRKYTSKINGNSIFLPAAGYRYWSSLGGAGYDGFYWSSTPYESSTYGAFSLAFGSGDFNLCWYGRFYGHSVRPVTSK